MAERESDSRDAASLVLLRQTSLGAEVLMGRRRAEASFAPGVFVFPGGTLDPADETLRDAPTPRSEVLALMTESCDAGLAQALAVTAIRETFEETGLLLGTAGDSGGPAGATWEDLLGAGVAPALDRLDYLGRALTPAWSPIRFHARFFLAWEDQARGALGGDGELVDLGWVPLNEVDRLPVFDVTAFMLDEVRRLFGARGDTARRRRFFTYGPGGPVIRED